jgi:hypothetical protein
VRIDPGLIFCEARLSSNSCAKLSVMSTSGAGVGPLSLAVIRSRARGC